MMNKVFKKGQMPCALLVANRKWPKEEGEKLSIRIIYDRMN
jgi:hypothetical protein